LNLETISKGKEITASLRRIKKITFFFGFCLFADARSSVMGFSKISMPYCRCELAIQSTLRKNIYQAVVD